MSVDNERRIAGGRRIPIKTIVEIGAGEDGSSAFEAESINVTASGMHLRTAYLPEIGEPLVCRFEGNGREIIVQGEVTWRTEEACGGDFGVRFSEIDGESLAALRELTGEAAAEADAAEAPTPDQVQRGTRVRLHIEGLASPMKARVRDAGSAELQVGSNLEFLKVGRPLELENVDGASKRGARIERVNIEVDPATQIPQLIVALRYLDAPDEPKEEILSLSNKSAKSRGSAVKESERTRTRMAPTSMDEQRDDELIDDEVDAMKENGATAIWNKVKQVGPVLMILGDKAKSVVNQAVEKASAFRARHEGKDEAPSTRRTTSPAPGGGIKSFGRKSSQDDLEEEPLDEVPGRKINKRMIGVGAAVVMLAVLAIAMTRKPAKPAELTASAEDPAASALVASPEGAAAPGGNVVAAVPLFGNTPMATNEPAAIPAAPPAAAAAATPPPGDALIAQAQAAPAGEAGGGDDDSADDSADENKGSSGSSHSAKGSSGSSAPSGGHKSFGRGKVSNPLVMSLRMVGNIKGLHGAPTATGFTVHVAGTQSKDTAAALKRHDPRIASIRMVNAGNGSDLTVQFKDGVPAFSVRANGNALQIALGRGDKADKKSAKAGKTEHAKGKTKSKSKPKGHAKH